MKLLHIVIWGLVLFLAGCSTTSTIKPVVTDTRSIQGTPIGYQGNSDQVVAEITFYNVIKQVVEARTIGKSTLKSDGSFSFKLREELPDEWLLEFSRFEHSSPFYCPDMTISKPNAKQSTIAFFFSRNDGEVQSAGNFLQGSNRDILKGFDDTLEKNFLRIDRIYANQAFEVKGTCQFKERSYKSAFDQKFKKGWNLSKVTYDKTTNILSYVIIPTIPEGMKWFYEKF